MTALNSVITTSTERQFDTLVTLGTHLKARLKWLVKREHGILIPPSAKVQSVSVQWICIFKYTACRLGPESASEEKGKKMPYNGRGLSEPRKGWRSLETWLWRRRSALQQLTCRWNVNTSAHQLITASSFVFAWQRRVRNASDRWWTARDHWKGTDGRRSACQILCRFLGTA